MMNTRLSFPEIILYFIKNYELYDIYLIVDQVDLLHKTFDESLGAEHSNNLKFFNIYDIRPIHANLITSYSINSERIRRFIMNPFENVLSNNCIYQITSCFNCENAKELILKK